ncbi:MAG: NADH:ubiquinone reductase (Na(+)-transporting) subunit B [Bacteroidota bacterium]
MKPILKFFENSKAKLEKTPKKRKWIPVLESFETFFFVPGITTKKGSHIRDAMDMKRTMSVVVLALVPALLFGMWNLGHWHFMSIGETATLLQKWWFGFLATLPLIVVSYAVGLGAEFVFVYIKGHEINEGFLVSGLLIPMICPVDVPLWMVAVATIFAVVLGKEIFGGTGMNIMNPALLTRAFLFFAYPASMSGDKVWIAGLSDGKGIIDGFSGATPLGQLAAESGEKVSQIVDCVGNPLAVKDMFFGIMPGSIGETSVAAILIGALLLLFTGIGSFRIMASVFAGGYLTGLLFNAWAANDYMAMPAHYHLLLGGFAFGAVFMATDPVTASQTKKGKIIYGFIIGVLAVLIRVLNPAYPEGMMLAILLMNVFAPLIDHFVVAGNIKRRLKRAKATAQLA